MTVKFIDNTTLNEEPVALGQLPLGAAFHLNNVNARSPLIYITTDGCSRPGEIWCFPLEDARCGTLVSLRKSTPVLRMQITLAITGG